MKHFVFFFFCLGIFQPIWAQEEDEIDAFLDEFFASENPDVEALLNQLDSNFIYLSTTYQNKTFFSGRNYGLNQYRLSPQLTYFLSNGIALSYNANYYSKTAPPWDNQNIGISYTKKIPRSPLGVMGSFSRSIYSQSQFTDVNYLSLGIFANQKDYHFGGGLFYSLGGDSFTSNQWAANVFYKFTLSRFSTGKITFRPEISMLWGNYTYEVERGHGMQSNLITISDFSKINSLVLLPIHYYQNSIDFSLEYGFNFPTLLKSESSVSNSSYIGVCFGYFISL